MNTEEKEKIAAMRTGGKIMADIKVAVRSLLKPGVVFLDIEDFVTTKIREKGAKPSFSTVPGYNFTTCITKNEGCCHGVPDQKAIAAGDVITVDMGLIWGGYHVDTTITEYVLGDKAPDPKVEHFLKAGKSAQHKAVAKARAGNSVYDISKAMEETVESYGYAPVYQLTGHAVGHELHEDPQIPCVAYRSDKKRELVVGMTIAIETMYARGDAFLVLGKDGWTYETADKSLTGMFEDTVLITSGDPEILT